MKKLLLIAITALALSGCGMIAGDKTGGNGATGGNSAPADTAKIKVGDTVVAKWSTGSFYEGKVEKIDGSKYTVAWLDKSNPSNVDGADVYAIPANGSKPDAKVGDMVLTKTASTGSYWTGASITAIEGDVYKVQAVSSTTSVNVPAEKIIKVSSATAADFKDKAGATDFLKDAQAGRPTVPDGFTPKKGDRVVAEWSKNSWYSGKVDNISGTNIYVAWDDMSKPSAVTADRVMPMPTGQEAKMPTANQYLLIKPENGSKWQYSQAASVNGSTVEAKLPDGKTRTVKTSEFILLN